MAIDFEYIEGEEIELEEKGSLVPAGKYNVTVVDAEVGTFAEGPDKPNGGRPSLKLQFQDVDGRIGKMRIFANIGLFGRWAATAKNPKGSDNFGLFNFLAALNIQEGETLAQANKRMRKDFKDRKPGLLPDPEELLGVPLVAVVTVKNGNNNVSFLPAGSPTGYDGASSGGTSNADLDDLEEL